MNQPEKERKTPLFTAKYKVTEQEFAQHCLLLTGPNMACRKRNISRYLVLLTIFEFVYYLTFVKGNDYIKRCIAPGVLSGVLIGLWVTAFACFVYLHWLFGAFIKLTAKGEYRRDEYSKSEVTLEAFEDGVLETAAEPNFVEFSKICRIYSNEMIYLLISEEKQTVVIPKNEKTKPIIELIDEKTSNLKFRYEEEEPEHGPGSTKEIVAEMLKK